MSYIINKTDGSVLTEVVDGTIDQTTTDITLVGKNSTSYGELFNENFVKVLENFSNSTQPNNPLQGQLWYDTTEGRLKVYDGSGFKVSGGTIVSPTAPSSIGAGDIWIDSFTQRLYFNDGSANLLAGPAYTAQQGISGWNVVDVIDTNNINHTTLFLYCGQVLLGIFSNSTVDFTPLDDIPGYGTVIDTSGPTPIDTGVSRPLKIGFNVANVPGFKFNAPASQADTLVAEDGTLKDAQSFLQVDPADGYIVSNGTIRVLNSSALILGTNQNTEFKYDNNVFQINSNVPNQNFSLQSLSTSLKSSIYVNAQNEYVGIYTSNPTATLDVNGNTRIRGNLTVEGATTTINTTNVQIEDLLIEIGKVDTPTDTTANGGGISLAGATSKTFAWGSAEAAWNSSENINLVSGKTYKISNFSVLSQTQLGNTVTSAPGLNSIGTLNQLQVDDININGETISFINNTIADGNIVLVPKGAGTVNVSSKRISNVATPSTDTDATNKLYVDTKVRSAPLGFSVNIGALTEAQLAGTILSKIFMPEDYEDDTILRVYCLDNGVSKEYKKNGPTWIYQADIV
jgi:hypothetical protein